MGPIDYTSAMGQADPMGAFTKALQAGQDSQKIMIERQKQEMAMAQAKQQQEQAQMQQQALSELANNPNPTARDYARVSTLIPSMSEQLNKTWQLLAPEQQRGRLDVGYQSMAAVRAGKPELAAELLKTQADAASRSGDKQGAEGYANWSKILTMDPDGGSKTLGLMLSQIDPKFAENYDKLTATEARQTMAPLELREKAAAATIREAEAGVAGEKALLSVDSLRNDMEWKKQDSRIKAMMAAWTKEGNDLKRIELRQNIDKAVQEQEKAARNLQAEVDTTLSGISDGLSLVSDIKKSGIGATTGLKARLPWTDERGTAAQVEQLKNMLTLEKTKYLKGAMSDGDINLLRKSATTLDIYGASEDVKRELQRIESILKRADIQTRKQYGIKSDYLPPGVNAPPVPVTDQTRAVPIPGQAPRPIKVDF
jgi:hypothetical protein